ncbi:MAG: hypothetical protein AAFW75_03135, partial [Cyanobacteria bacterium J06636_16]
MKIQRAVLWGRQAIALICLESLGWMSTAPAMAQPAPEQDPQMCVGEIGLNFWGSVVAEAERGRQALNQGQVQPATEHFAASLQLIEAVNDASVKVRLIEPFIRTNSFESGWLVTDVGNLVDRGEAKAVRTILAPALAVTQSLPSGHSFLKTRLLATIAAHYGAIGDQETAVDLLTQARQAEVNIQGAEFKAKALTAIAEGYKAAEASAIAAEISTLALQQAELVEYPNPVRRAWVVQPIAVVFAQAGDLKQALAIAQSIEDANYRDRTVSDIALASAQAGQADLALELLQTVTFAEPKAETLAAIGSQLANEGSEEPARLFFEQALEAAGSEAYLQLRVAQALMQVGFLEDADAALSALPEGEFKAKGLMELVRLQAEAGEPETASEWLLQAVEATAAVEEGYRREELLEAVYGQAIALEAYDVAVATIQGRSDPEVFVTFDETVAYRDLASAAAQAGHFEVALEAVEAIDPSFYDPINQAWLAIARAH